MDRKMTTLIGLVCLLAGVIVGFLLAPVKKGIYCGTNNGNSYGGWGYDDEEEDEDALPF